MNKKTVAALVLSSCVILTTCVERIAVRNTSTNKNAFTPATEQQDAYSQLKAEIGKLRSEDKSERERAKSEILAFSNKSVEDRRHVIRELIKLAVVPNGDAEFLRSHERFLAWSEAADILGTMKATEAISVLISCLDCSNGRFNLGLGIYPAALAIIKIGDEAVPQLAEALEQKSLVQFVAAKALYAIGGDKAKEVLKKALRKERDKQFAAILRNTLRNWDNSGKYKP